MWLHCSVYVGGLQCKIKCIKNKSQNKYKIPILVHCATYLNTAWKRSSGFQISSGIWLINLSSGTQPGLFPAAVPTVKRSWEIRKVPSFLKYFIHVHVLQYVNLSCCFFLLPIFFQTRKTLSIPQKVRPAKKRWYCTDALACKAVSPPPPSFLSSIHHFSQGAAIPQQWVMRIMDASEASLALLADLSGISSLPVPLSNSNPEDCLIKVLVFCRHNWGKDTLARRHQCFALGEDKVRPGGPFVAL